MKPTTFDLPDHKPLSFSFPDWVIAEIVKTVRRDVLLMSRLVYHPATYGNVLFTTGSFEHESMRRGTGSMIRVRQPRRYQLSLTTGAVH